METCAQPLLSRTWLAAMQLVTEQCGGQPGRLAVMGEEAFTAAVRGAVAGWGGKKAWGSICRRIFAALTDTEGVVAWSRRGLLRRVADELGDLQRIRAQLRVAETDMAGVLDELGLSRLADTPALTAVGAAAVLAETGDPRRYDSSSSLVKHAGLSPSDNASGAFLGDARISRRGRPGLRLAVWRAVWPMLQFNPVMAAKYQAMTEGPATPQAKLPPARGRPARRPPLPGRGAPRPASPAPPRCCAGFTPWSSTAPAGMPPQLPARPPASTALARRRPPDRPVLPEPGIGAPRPSSPMRGRASPSRRRGPTPWNTLGSSPPVAWSFSPARLNAVGAGLPAHPQAGRARLHYVEREDPGDGRLVPVPARHGHHAAADLQHARTSPHDRVPAPARAHRHHP